MRIAVLVLNILGLNCISRFVTGHIGTGILALLIDIFAIIFILYPVGWILLGIGGIIYIVDLITVCTGNWKCDGKYLNDWGGGSRTTYNVNLNKNDDGTRQSFFGGASNFRNVTLAEKSSNNVNLSPDNVVQVSGKNWRDILIDNNLAEYIETFEKNKLTDLNIITELSEMDLEKLGIGIMGDRKKMLKIFSEVNSGNDVKINKRLKEDNLICPNLKQTEYRGEEDLENDDNWICGKCGTLNDIYLAFCKKCGKEFMG